MAIGNALIGDLEELMATRAVRRRNLFRMSGADSQCWRAEQELQQMYDGSRCLLLPSATVGLSLLLEVLGPDAGSEVLIAPFGWVSNWSCLARAGLTIRFLPLDENLQLQPKAVAERMTDRTAAVVVAHLMGRGQQGIREIAELCRERGIPLLEDVAQSFGVSVEGQRAGTFGWAGWCSLNHHKILSTGDGGFVVLRDEAVYARVTARHDQGCVLVDGKRRPHPDELEPGLSLRVTDLTAAVLRAQIARYPLIRNRILALHESLASACRELGLELLTPHEGDLAFTVLFRRPATLRYPSLVDSGWHVASGVPWLAQELSRAARADEALAATIEFLGATSALGSGFIDPYLAAPLGLEITDSPEEARAVARRLDGQR